MKIRYITIEREYGSGGTEIAEQVAEKCGIHCYGKEILEKAASKLHITAEEAEQYEEKVTSSFMYSMFVMSQAQAGTTSGLPMESRLYVEEHNAIAELAHNGKAVFVGHCASEALKEHDCVLRVFIRADEEFKTNRAIQEYGIDPKEAGAVCRRFNKKRANYYTFNTQKQWNDFSNYDIVLDSSRIGIDGCVKALCALISD